MGEEGLLNQIDYPDHSSNFVTFLIPGLIDYGNLHSSEQPALVALAEVIKEKVGKDKRREIDELVELLYPQGGCNEIRYRLLLVRLFFEINRPEVYEIIQWVECCYQRELPVNLAGLDLSGLIFEAESFSKKGLSNAIMRGAVLEKTVLRGINLANADLRGAILDDADLFGSDLTHANLARASLQHTNLSNVIFCRTCLYHANLRDAQFINGSKEEERQRQEQILEQSLDQLDFNDYTVLPNGEMWTPNINLKSALFVHNRPKEYIDMPETDDEPQVRNKWKPDQKSFILST